MQPVGAADVPAQISDLYFKCEGCGASLVVDGAAAGMTLQCQECGQPTTVPLAQESACHEADLRRHLKENESQRTEVTGYINQLNIQLHRWQLRLQTLNERNNELKSHITALRGATPVEP